MGAGHSWSLLVLVCTVDSYLVLMNAESVPQLLTVALSLISPMVWPLIHPLPHLRALLPTLVTLATL